MAKKEDRKKQKKRLKEKHKARKRAVRDKYPRVVVLEDGEDSGFMRTVEDIVRDFDFENDAHCSPVDRLMYRTFHLAGFDGLEAWLSSSAALQYAEERATDIRQIRREMLLPLLVHLGEWIFERLPDEFRCNPLPFRYYQVTPRDRTLVITFAFLPHVPSPHGTIYHAPFGPTVRLVGKDFTVGFTRHALERSCERLAPTRPISYRHFQPIALYFRHCDYYELIIMPSGQPAIRLLRECAGDTANIYLREVAGLSEDAVARESHYFVLGYCPIQIVRDYALATTFLCPGFLGTPEAGLVDSSSSLNGRKRYLMRGAAQYNTLAEVLSGRQSSLLKWYHDNGVPQVVTLKREIYRFG